MRYDYSIFNKLPLTDPPVGIKYEYFRPDYVKQLPLDVECSFCELLRRAQTENEAFYFSAENKETCVGKGLLGMLPPGSGAFNGEMGPRLGVFGSTRANLRTGRMVPTIQPGAVNYVVFAPLDKMNFDPDVMVFSAPPEVGEMVMRSFSYDSGEPYQSKCTAVVGCAWTMIYPYLENRINFVLPALVHGMHGRELYPFNIMLIGVPFNCIGTMLKNLEEMKLHMSGHASRQAYLTELDEILTDLKMKNR